jgi:hypothetical protein
MDAVPVSVVEGPVFRALVTLPEAQREGPQSYPFVIFLSISYNCL